METAGPSSQMNADAAEKSELNRNLKRNIGELAMEAKKNDYPKSPARKEVKVAHEIHLRRELEQWKQLVTDESIRQSLLHPDANTETPENLNDILTADQRRYIDDACDVQKMIDESREFRRKFEFFVRLHQLFVDLSNEVANEALDAVKEQAFRVQIENIQFGIPQFCLLINKPSNLSA